MSFSYCLFQKYCFYIVKSNCLFFQLSLSNRILNNPIASFNIQSSLYVSNCLFLIVSFNSRIQSSLSVSELNRQKVAPREKVKFKCLVKDKYEEIVSNNQIVDFIENDDSRDDVWKFREILSHKLGLCPHYPEY
jgi:hypothetical protein